MKQFTETEMKLGNDALVIGGLVEAQWSKTTYWTCFAYAGVEPGALHCTHKYLGEQQDEDLGRIQAILESYFATPRKVPTVVFRREDFFGPDGDVRVLRPESDDASWFLLDLRKRLDTFAEDDYPEIKPHVTTTLDAVMMPFTRYCLCQGGKILAEYPL